MDHTVGEEYEIVIERKSTWFSFDWHAIWEFRDLLILLVRRDFVSKYKQTILGPAWYVIQPLLMTVVFTIIFGKVAKISTDTIPPLLFYLCGLSAWGYFSNTLNANSNVFVSNMHIFGKVYFPRLVVPLANCLSGLFGYAVQLITFLAFYAYFKFLTSAGGRFEAQSELIFLPFLLLQAGLLALGTGLWLSALTAKYRDFAHLSNLLMQLWMYATPIIYPLSEIPNEWRWIAYLNPMAPIVETYKYAFFGQGKLSLYYSSLSVGITGLVLFTGLLLFSRVERNFVDSV